MLVFLQGKGSDRKLRLSACAIAVGLLGELGDEESRRKIEAIERFAKKADLKDLITVTGYVLSPGRGTFYRSYGDEPPYVRPGSIIIPDMDMGLLDSTEGLYGIEAECFGVVIEVLANSGTEVEDYAPLFRIIPLDDTVPHHRHDTVTNYLRCIFGPLPFRPVALNPAWTTPAVVQLARSLYEERRFEEMSVLADALEEAGWKEAAVLEHCRGPGPHVRGCWVLDLILGKE
jgi:biotin carboxyl carrier protein